jgi:threonine dehydrogenase-like Zn-dependent dehydrogenase
MGLTLVEKIAARHADGLAAGAVVRAGDFVSIRPRHVMTHDNTGAVIPKFKQIDATASDPVAQIREATDGKGVDVSIELVGSAITMGHTVRCLGIFGRAALAGLSAESMSVLPYPEVINKEAEIIGVSDHLAAELASLIQLALSGKLSCPQETLRAVALDPGQINAALDEVTKSSDHIRTVIVPRA